jgi:hypothetical protein
MQSIAEGEKERIVIELRLERSRSDSKSLHGRQRALVKANLSGRNSQARRG